MIGITLIKLLMNKEVFDKYYAKINIRIADVRLRKLLQAIETYYEKFPDKDINPETFSSWFLSTKVRGDKEYKFYAEVLAKMSNVDCTAQDDIIQSFQEDVTTQYLQKILNDKFDIDRIKKVIEYHERHLPVACEEEEGLVVNDLDAIFAETRPNKGLNWGLDFLNESIGPLSTGMFTIVAAYVDVGKTAFCISQAVHMAQQIKEGNILYLNNEEADLRVLKKIWKSALGYTDEELFADKEKAKRLYTATMHGDMNRIKFFNISKKSAPEIEALIKKHNPRLVIIDQIDKVYTSRQSSYSEHDRLKGLYGEARQWANVHCPIIAISQADASAARQSQATGEVEYTLFPHHRQLDGSKVGKPGEADAIVMIGKKTGCDTTRGIHVSKNKFGVSAKREVNFDGARCRYQQ